MIMDNLATAIMEVIVFLIEVLPTMCQGLVFLLAPIFGLSVVGFLAMTRGWEHVAQTLTEKWVDKGLQLHWFTYHNQETATKILSAGAHLAVVLGIVLNISLILFMIWFGYQLLNGFPSIFDGLHENNPWG